MDYKDLINAHFDFGTKIEDIINRNQYQDVLEDVVIAPWWNSSIFSKFADCVEKQGDKVYNVFGEGFKFTFLELKNIGAPAILEAVLPLALTRCKRIFFIGSVGAIDPDIKIGDLVVPEYSYNGVGACRFLNDNLEDDFEIKTYPSKKLSDKLISIAKASFRNSKIHVVPNYSLDTIFAQFPHINHFIDLNCKTVEMETSALFKCADIAKIEACALLCVSDNTMKKQSLFSGRSENEKELKKLARDETIPQIIIETIKSNK